MWWSAGSECPKQWWDVDKVETCHRQRYFEFLPLILALAVCVAYSLLRCIPALIRNIPGWWRKRNNQTPLLASDTTDEEVVTSKELIERPANRSNKKAFVIIRTKSITDRLRLVLELVLCTTELALCVLLWANDVFRNSYARYCPNAIIMMVFTATYTWLLVIYRIAGWNSIDPLPGAPYDQCAYLYSVQLVVYFVTSYCLWVSYQSEVSNIILYSVVGVAFMKWLLLFSSPLGDGAARIYKTPHIPPSIRPICSLIRAMGCCWNSGLIFYATEKGKLDPNDVWDLEESAHSYELLDKWHQYKRTHKTRNPLIMLLLCFKAMSAGNLIFGCTASFLALVPTIFVNKILKYTEDMASTPRVVAWLYVLGIGAALLLEQTVNNQAFYHGRRLSVAMRAIIIAEIYQKALLSQVSVQKKESEEEEEEDAASEEPKKDNDTDQTFDPNNTGAVINLMSVDAFKVAEFASYLHYLIASPLMVVAGVAYLYTVLGWSSLAGVAIMCITIPLNYLVAKKFASLQDQNMAVTDKRVDKTNEALNAVRIIKYFAWEQFFADGILKLRGKELDLLYRRYLWWSFAGLLFYLIPPFITAASFICYVKVEHEPLTSSIAFTALAVFNILKYPLDDIANNVSRFMSCKVSIDRIKTYLNIDETPKYEQEEKESAQPIGPDSPKIGFQNASFSWSRKSDDGSVFKLRDIDIKFHENDLNVIIGPTGSGKTSLLMALLGEMFITKGRVFLPHAANRRKCPVDANGLAETVAYCPQQAWMVNDTVRNNILFAAPYDHQRYKRVLKACELERDLEILSDGDQTLIGDKGISLSGGQKQRVSLARAMYSNSRHLILDDCLSAVDSHTADGIYRNALTGSIARDRTIILVSHNVALTVSQASLVVVMRNGRVESQGTPNELVEQGKLGTDELVLKSARESMISRANSGIGLSEMVANPGPPPEHAPHGDAQETLDSQLCRDIERRGSVVEPDNVLAEETRGLGSIPLTVYKRYAGTLGTPMWWIVLTILMLLSPISQYMEAWWLKYWTSSYRDTIARIQERFILILMDANLSEDAAKGVVFYGSIYILTGLIYATVCTANELVAYRGSIRSSKILFEDLLRSILSARIAFFDTTPLGRIINRFSKDIEDIDQELMPELWLFCRCILDALTTTIVISYVTPGFIPAGILICVAYSFIGRYYLNASRELKRLESTTRSPIFQQFGETLVGAVCIRAYGDVVRFSTHNENLVDDSHRPYFNLWLANRWLAYWSSFMSMAVVVFASAFVVWKAEVIGPGFAGVSLSYSMMFGDAILWIVRMYAQVEIHMNSIERIEEYVSIDHEAPSVIPESRPPKNWPQKGSIEFNKLSLSYSDNGPLVIKDVSFEVEGGQKVGVIGPTGAGKSTILSALFRILEPVSGSVQIDGLDISTIGLRDLRSALAIIPQDPTLFTGTLRSNLDLYGDYTDDQLFSALSRVELVPEGTNSKIAKRLLEEQEANTNLENKNQFLELESEVTEGGSNLSQGQRQLLCLARSLLRSPKILLLDEATASIDYETDAMIQKTIREEFASVTILTIAHRLRTIADYDMVLVLDQGQVSQYGKPVELLKNKAGMFYKLCEKSGDLDTIASLVKK